VLHLRDRQSASCGVNRFSDPLPQFPCKVLNKSLRRVLLRQARSIEERALEIEDEKEQGDFLELTVALRILAELMRVKSVN
jgi:hypothetical protein